MASVGSVVVDMRGNTATFSADMSKARSILKNTTSGMASDVGSLNSAVGMLSKGFAAVGVSLSVGAFVSWQKQLIAAAAETKNLAAQLNIGIETLQALDAEAADVGSSAEALHGSIKKLTEAVGEATGGNRTIQQSFVDLGVSFEDVNGKARDTEDVLQDIAQGYVNASDKTKYLSDASNVLGKDVTTLVPLFDSLATGVDTVTEKQKEMGRVASEDTIRALEAFGSEIDKLANQIVVAAQTATAEWLYMLGIMERPIKNQISQVQVQINDLVTQRTKLQQQVESIGTSSDTSAQKKMIELLNTKIGEAQDEYIKLQKQLQGTPEGKDMSGVTGYKPPAAAPTVTPGKTGTSDKEKTSAVTELSRRLSEQNQIAAETGVQAAITAAQIDLMHAAQTDYANGLRGTAKVGAAENALIAEQVKELYANQQAHKNATKSVTEHALAVDQLFKSQQDDVELGKLSGLQKEQEAALDKLRAAALSDYNNHKRKSIDLTQEEIDKSNANVKALHDQEAARDADKDAIEAQKDALDEMKKAAEEAAQQEAQMLQDVGDVAHSIGDEFVDAAGKMQSWKDAGMNAAKTLFDFLFDQLMKLQVFGGEGGGIFDAIFGGGGGGLFGGGGGKGFDIGGIFGSIFGGGGFGSGGGKFAGGGSFTVGGAGSTDSKLVAFKATPGERVSVGHGSASGDTGDGVQVIINNYSDQKASATESRGANGQKLIQVAIGDGMSRDLRERGPASQALEATYGLTRKAY